MSITLWQKCVVCLKADLPAQQFNTWIRPIQVMNGDGVLHLLAPNRFVLEWVKEHFLAQINDVMQKVSGGNAPSLMLEVQGPKQEFLLPYKKEFIRQVDRAERWLVVALPDGLIDL